MKTFSFRIGLGLLLAGCAPPVSAQWQPAQWQPGPDEEMTSAAVTNAPVTNAPVTHEQAHGALMRGYECEHGKGVEKNREAAAQLFEKAALTGHALAGGRALERHARRS